MPVNIGGPWKKEAIITNHNCNYYHCNCESMNLEAGGSPKPVLHLSRQVVQGRVVLAEPVFRCLQMVEPVVLVECRRDDLIIRVMVIMVMTMAMRMLQVMMVVTETF